MDDFSDGLGVGFAIDAGQSFATMHQLETAMDSAEAKIVGNAERIERATTGMINLGGAAATIRSFGGDVTRAEQQAARSLAAVEKAGESLSRQLDRQASSFGRTREEIRAAKVETAALAAEQQGLTELASRLRAQEQSLFEAEFAAARKSRAEAEAAAEEKERAAAAAAAAAEAEAISVRKAADAYRMFEAVARQRSAAYRQQLADEAAAQRSSQDQAAAVERLRASIDPAYAAQQRFNSEMDQARRLVSTGSISLDEYVAKLRLERAALQEAGVAAKGHGSAMAAMAPQMQDALTQASMGANLFSVLAIQGGQAASQMIYMEGAAGKFATFMMSGWGIALQAGLFILGALTDGLFKGGEASDDMNARQSALASQLDQTTGKIKEQVTWLSILSNSRDAEQKLQKGAGAYRSAQDRFTQAGRMAGVRFLPDQEPVDTVSASGRAFINQQLGRYNGGYNGGLSAEQVIKNLKAAAEKDPSMRDAVKQIEGYAFAVDKASANNRTLQVQLARTAIAMGTATAEQRRLVAANTDTSTGDKSIIDARAKLAGATTAAGKAQASYALQLALADQQYEKSKKTDADQQRLLQARTKAEHDYSTAQEASSAAKRSASAAARDARKEQTLAEQLAREAAAIEAQITNLNALADAYRLSGGAALIAEARVRGESKAIKERGDIEAEVARQVRLAIAQRVSQAEQNTASIRAQATAQDAVNTQVAAGLVPAERAEELIKNRIADLPLLAAIEAAQQQGLATAAARATQALADQRAERERLAAGERTRQFQASQASGADKIAELQEELRLINATDAARAHALATLRATQEASRLNPEDREAYIAQQVKIADLQQALTDGQREYNDSLTLAAEQWDLIARNVEAGARGMADAFGQAGRSLGDMAAIYADYRAEEARAKENRDAALKAARTEEQVQRANARFALQTSTAQIGVYGDMAAAAKGFFGEGTAGYRALATAEKAFRAVEFALSVRAMAQDAVETAGSIARSGARAAALGAEAVVKAISSLPFPLNLVAGAATAAAIASLGIAIVGSFGGSGGSPLQRPNDGTGTVLGDPSAKTESLKRALDELKQVDTLTNVYSRQMLASLRSIDSQLSGVASVIVRSGDVSASANVVTGYNNSTGKAVGGVGGAAVGAIAGSFLGPVGSVVGAVLGSTIGKIIGGLFGTRTDVTGSGIFGGPQSIGSINAGGFNGQAYSDVTKTRKIFGIVSGRSYSTEYGALDPALSNQFTLVLRGFNDAIKAAAVPLGESTDAIQQRLNGFVLNIGKIDLKGLTGEQIQEKLNAIFGAAADNMATAAFPLIAQFQKVGEGAFETLTRVATTVEQVSSSLDLLGASAKGMGIGAKLGLADQFESASALNDAATAYFQAYYSSEEQAAAKTAQMTKVFNSLGITMPSTLASFRQLVEAQDLTTAAGQATYATLLKLAPAFADLQQSLQGAKSAADILSERQDLERQLLELQGKTDEIRKLDLAKLDASNRALQLQIWAVQDAQAAAQAADELRKAWTSVGDSIMDEVKRIRGLSTNGGATSFAMLMGQFNAANTAARGGDQDAAKSLPQLSQALLAAAANAATSRQELARVQAQTAASLEATYAAIGKLGANAAAASDAALLAAASTAQGAAAGASDNAATIADLRTALAALTDEVKQMRSDNNAGHAATAANTAKSAKVLGTAQDAAGGGAIATKAVA